MKKLGLLCGLLFGLATACVCQSTGPNVVLITLDGFRWQELFEGADSVLLNKQAAGDERAGIYWHPDPETRRKILMPFIWSEIVTKGQLSGNRNFGWRRLVPMCRLTERSRRPVAGPFLFMVSYKEVEAFQECNMSGMQALRNTISHGSHGSHGCACGAANACSHGNHG